MLLAARGTAGQLRLCTVLVWRAALRTVTLSAHTHTRWNTHGDTKLNMCGQTHYDAQGFMVPYRHKKNLRHKVDSCLFIAFFLSLQDSTDEEWGKKRATT